MIALHRMMAGIAPALLFAVLQHDRFMRVVEDSRFRIHVFIPFVVALRAGEHILGEGGGRHIEHMPGPLTPPGEGLQTLQVRILEDRRKCGWRVRGGRRLRPAREGKAYELDDQKDKEDSTVQGQHDVNMSDWRGKGILPPGVIHF
jgi:hypothetical protein